MLTVSALWLAAEFALLSSVILLKVLVQTGVVVCRRRYAAVRANHTKFLAIILGNAMITETVTSVPLMSSCGAASTAQIVFRDNSFCLKSNEDDVPLWSDETAFVRRPVCHAQDATEFTFQACGLSWSLLCLSAPVDTPDAPWASASHIDAIASTPMVLLQHDALPVRLQEALSAQSLTASAWYLQIHPHSHAFGLSIVAARQFLSQLLSCCADAFRNVGAAHNVGYFPHLGDGGLWLSPTATGWAPVISGLIWRKIDNRWPISMKSMQNLVVNALTALRGIGVNGDDLDALGAEMLQLCSSIPEIVEPFTFLADDAAYYGVCCVWTEDAWNAVAPAAPRQARRAWHKVSDMWDATHPGTQDACHLGNHYQLICLRWTTSAEGLLAVKKLFLRAFVPDFHGLLTLDQQSAAQAVGAVITPCPSAHGSEEVVTVAFKDMDMTCDSEASVSRALAVFSRYRFGHACKQRVVGASNLPALC